MSYDKCQIRFHFCISYTHSKHTQISHTTMLSHNSGGHVDDDHDSTTNLTTNNHHHHHHKNLTRVSAISSSSSSNASTNHSLFFKNTKPMEEVWKDINLTATTKGYRGFILQDFLAKPFSSNNTHDTPTTNNVSSSSPPAPAPVPMMLNLNSGPDQLNILGEDPTRNVVCPPFEQVLASSTNSSSGLLGHHDSSIGGLRMFPATERTGGGDRRHKRMIKNRESAARSRARKQAYTNELENEVERLKEENAMLKRQQQLQAASAAQMTKKGGLQRTSTAPF